ncbi:MAG: hypothetical protein FJX78_06105 [Armatimonadetes bacterium]|nr:hypothetical protein [Armatimonadota bacterium]
MAALEVAASSSAPAAPEDELLKLLREPLNPDEVAACMGRSDSSAILAALTALELKGLVRRVHGGRYLRSGR